MIPDSVINDIQDRLNIVDVISQHVPLKKAGKNFKGLCPFHDEKTPSFSVSPDKQIFHCFGCGVSGSVFTFLMKRKQMDFPDAVRELASRVGVTVPDDERGREKMSEAAEIESVVKAAAEFYAKALMNTPESSPIRRYIAQRGLTRESVLKFGIGYSPEGWDNFYRHASKQTAPSVLERAGLVLTKSAGGYYDRFRDRMMFPIVDTRGKYLGFGARALEAETQPKYVNSPETPIYQKGRHLYGLNLAADAIRKEGQVILVEGYLDVITCAQGGVENVVASSGTALTVEQARLMKRYANTIVVLFDGDKAGEMATLRGLDVLLQEDCEVRIAEVPQGHDPDSYMRAAGADRFRKTVIDKSKSIFDYKHGVLARKYDAAVIEDRVKIAMEMLETIRRIPNEVLKSSLVKKLAGELRLSETALLNEMAKKGAGVTTLFRTLEAPKGDKDPGNYVPMIERILIGLFLTFPSCAERAKLVVTAEDFKNARARSVVEMIFECESEEGLKPSRFLNRIQEDREASSLVAQSIHEVESIGDQERAFRDCVGRIAENRQKRQSDSLRKEIELAEVRGDKEKLKELLEEFSRQSKPGRGPSTVGKN